MASPTPTAEEDPPIYPKRFRFKSTSSRKASRSPSRSPSSRSHRHHHHRHHHRSKRRKTSSTDENESFAPSFLDSETAFRESLFDALADDEGAAYWEGVYGQPIHNYPRLSSKHSTNAAVDDLVATENIHMMTDEEYVTYVRAKMWEKSHQHILEERRRRDEERSRRKKLDEEGRRLEKGVEEALRRGEERRRKARWKDRWTEYLKGWEQFTQQVDADGGTPPVMQISKRIPWPVLSGMWQDVNEDEVERFFRHAPRSTADMDDVGLLKLERVRWHPDKVQQRAGNSTIDKETMKTITAVFQIIDKLWSITRSQ